MTSGSAKSKGSGFINCGRIGRAVGLKGECAVRWISGDSPVKVGDGIFLGHADDKSYRPYTVAALRRQGRFYVLRLDGVEDREAARALTGLDAFVAEDALPELPEGEYYCHQILGMRVATEDGRELGEVVRVFTAGENDVYEVMPDGGSEGQEIQIPATDEVVISIDVGANRMIVRPMEGMLD